AWSPAGSRGGWRSGRGSCLALPIHRALRAEPVRVSPPQLLHVEVGDVGERRPGRIRQRGDVPEEVPELLCQVLKIQRVAVADVLLDGVRDLPSLARDAKGEDGEGGVSSGAATEALVSV